MDPISPIISAIATTQNLAVLVLMVVCYYLLKALTESRKEDRAARELQEQRAIAAQTQNNLVLDKVATALTEMRITLASKGIRNDGS